MCSLWAIVSFTLAFVAIRCEETTPDDVQFKVIGDEFLHDSDFDKSLVDVVTEDDLERILEKQIQALRGAGAQKARLPLLMASLRPLFTALPKDIDNRLAYQTARYALHRYMMKAHGWFIRGLEPSSQEKAHRPGEGVVAEWVPPYLHGLISTRSGMDGESLEDLALTVATIEDLVEIEVTKKMTAVYKYLGISTAEPAVRDLAVCAIDTFVYYMFTFAVMETTKGKDPFDLDSSFNTSGHRDKLCNGGIHKKYFEWAPGIWHWRHLAYIAKADSGPDLLSFQQVLDIAFTVAADSHKVHEADCVGLRDTLLSVESRPGSGRVTLDAYYEKKEYKHMMSFSESREILRNASVLDESTEPPTIVVANYVSNRINCCVPSSMYALCCKLPCDDILMQLEQKLASPVGTAGDIASGIGANLSHLQWKRLRTIERIHGGRVPIHSEVFAVWLHHVHPRDCPLVHPDRSSDFPTTAGEWLHDGDKSWAEESQAMAASGREGTASILGFLVCAMASSTWFTTRRPGSPTAQILQRALGETRAAVVRKLLAFLAAASGLVMLNGLHIGTCVLIIASFALVRGILQRLQTSRATEMCLPSTSSIYKQV